MKMNSPGSMSMPTLGQFDTMYGTSQQGPPSGPPHLPPISTQGKLLLFYLDCILLVKIKGFVHSYIIGYTSPSLVKFSIKSILAQSLLFKCVENYFLFFIEIFLQILDIN
jgi:hypothetical protein